MDQYKFLHPAKYYKAYLEEGIRPDGRELNAYRPVLVNSGSIATADGSALAKVGRTTVVCGIKAELCQPKAERADEGFIVPNIELPALCSPKFRPGPPSEQAQVYTQFIADIIENSECVNLKDLCLHPDKLAWCLYVDLICLDFDGSIIDACVIALIAALKSLMLPVVEYDPVLDNIVVNPEEKKALAVLSTPISSTFAIFENDIIVADPTVEEENLCSGIITVVTKDGDLCTVHKPGGHAVTDQLLHSCIRSGKQREPLIRNIINTAGNSKG